MSIVGPRVALYTLMEKKQHFVCHWRTRWLGGSVEMVCSSTATIMTSVRPSSASSLHSCRKRWMAMETWDEYAAIRAAIRGNSELIVDSGRYATRLRAVLVKMRLRELCDSDEGCDVWRVLAPAECGCNTRGRCQLRSPMHPTRDRHQTLPLH